MARNNKSGGGFNSFLNFIGLVDNNNSQNQAAQNSNSASGYGQPEAYKPNNRQQSDARKSGEKNDFSRRITAQGGRSNPGSRSTFEESEYVPPRRPSRFEEEPQQEEFAPKQRRPRTNFHVSDEPDFAPRTRNPEPAPQRNPRRASGRTVTCTVRHLIDCNPVMDALIRGDIIYLNIAAEDPEKTHIINTLSGAAYALYADFKKPKNFPTYILVPESADISDLAIDND